MLSMMLTHSRFLELVFYGLQHLADIIKRFVYLWQISSRHEAERALFEFPDHDYMYIESPGGTQHAWNPFRASWEWF